MLVGPLGAEAAASELVGGRIRPWVEVWVPAPQNGPKFGSDFSGVWVDSPVKKVLLVPSVICARLTERSLKNAPWELVLGFPCPVAPGQLYSV